MDLSKLKPNETKVFVIVERDDQPDYDTKPYDVLKAVYAGKSDSQLGFTVDSGEILFLDEESAEELVGGTANEASKLLVALAEFKELYLAQNVYAYAEAEHAATSADQGTFETFLKIASKKEVLFAMAKALGHEGNDFKGSVSGKRTKIKHLREKMKPAERDEAHTKAFATMRRLEKKHGASVKDTDMKEKVEKHMQKVAAKKGKKQP